MTTENTPESAPVPVPQDPDVRPVTLTQAQLNDLIRTRTERYRVQVTEARVQLAEAREDADRWRTRAKGNRAVADELRGLYGDLLSRLGAPAPAAIPAEHEGDTL